MYPDIEEYEEMPPSQSRLRFWAPILVPSIIAGLIAATSAYAAVSARIASTEVILESHVNDREQHISVEGAVTLERRLGTLEGAIERLNDNIERLANERKESPGG